MWRRSVLLSLNHALTASGDHRLGGTTRQRCRVHSQIHGALPNFPGCSTHPQDCEVGPHIRMMLRTYLFFVVILTTTL